MFAGRRQYVVTDLVEHPAQVAEEPPGARVGDHGASPFSADGMNPSM
jgi:hypothetical protein